jgi:holin-like protein
MRGFTILLLFNFAGLIMQAAGVPLPPAVLGLILFSAALFTGMLRPKNVEHAGDFLLKNLLLFFIPAIAGLVAFITQLRQEWFQIAVALGVSTVGSAVVAGYVAGLAEKKKKHHAVESVL